MGSKMCMNALCASTSTFEWKKGWPLRSGVLADLCHRCGSAYESSLFCDTFHVDQSGWRECCLCSKRLHCGCIASKYLVELLDFGGVSCTSCANSHQLNVTKRGENQDVFGRMPMKTLADRQHIIGESGMIGNNIDGGRIEADRLSHSQRCDSQSLLSGDKREEFISHHGFGKLLKSENVRYQLDGGEMHESPSQPSLNMALAVIPYSSSFSTGVSEGKKHITASHSHMLQCSTSVLPKPSKSVLASPSGTSKSAQARIGRPPVEGRGKGHLLPRYWPKYTDKELQQISGNLNLNITPLFEKTLSASDAGRIGRLVLPKACAEAYFPPINQSEGIPLKIQDVKGKEWTFQFRFWPNNNSRMYVLEGVTPCIQSMMLQAGDTVIFSRVDPGGKLVMGSRKAANAGDQQGCTLTNGTSAEDTSSSGVTETPSSINASSYPSQIPKELKGLPESSPDGGSSLKKSENNGNRICDDSPRVKDKKRTRTIGTKNKRLHLHSEEAMELRLTWEEAQDLLRPSPTAKPTFVTIEDYEIEEFDEPPVFGKKAIITSTPSGGQEQWAPCDDCSKWRRLPVEAFLPLRWTCSDNVWDEDRCSCSSPEENLKELENVLKVGREYKRRRIGERETAMRGQNVSGLDALASAAVLGDTLGENNAEPEVATTTRHPRHRAGCSCIVCIQPPSGKGRHKPNCSCNVCNTVKRRFKTLMMRRRKKQLEREGPAEEKEEVQKAESDNINKNKPEKEERIDLNSDPYNKEDIEAVVMEKGESRKREAEQCLVREEGVVHGSDARVVTEIKEDKC